MTTPTDERLMSPVEFRRLLEEFQRESGRRPTLEEDGRVQACKILDLKHAIATAYNEASRQAERVRS